MSKTKTNYPKGFLEAQAVAKDNLNRKALEVTKPPKNYPDPKPADYNSPEFDAIWQAIKSWDIAVPEWYVGSTGAMGNHVMAILNAVKKVQK